MEDRRIKKTKQAIQISFAKLLSEKSMDNITVKSLCEAADINKSTFYLHYKDIYDCADHLRDTIVDEFSKVIAPYSFEDIIKDFAVILENIMNMFDRNKDLYMPFLKSPSLAFSSCKMKQLMIEKILERADIKDRNSGIYRCTVSFVISGIISLLEQHEFAEIDRQTISTLAYKVQNGFVC
ncbi:MAG TPA: TetR/AcrR family transcriptional regulator [Firmicutes bacterium]|jgi:AcrR family transcriptional regulator|nr:TetR/AcrR family transcriptional regulator [Bacillota bacterium]